MAPSPALICIGSLQLQLNSDPSASSSTWAPLTTRWLHSLDVAECDASIVETVLYLLGDGIGFGGETRSFDRQAFVRVWMRPRDAPGGWEHGKAHAVRHRHLKRMFYALRKDWAGGGVWLMELTVGLLSTGLMLNE